jgi:hypothetical protein
MQANHTIEDLHFSERLPRESVQELTLLLPELNGLRTLGLSTAPQAMELLCPALKQNGSVQTLHIRGASRTVRARLNWYCERNKKISLIISKPASVPASLLPKVFPIALQCKKGIDWIYSLLTAKAGEIGVPGTVVVQSSSGKSEEGERKISSEEHRSILASLDGQGISSSVATLSGIALPAKVAGMQRPSQIRKLAQPKVAVEQGNDVIVFNSDSESEDDFTKAKQPSLPAKSSSDPDPLVASLPSVDARSKGTLPTAGENHAVKKRKAPRYGYSRIKRKKKKGRLKYVGEHDP